MVYPTSGYLRRKGGGAARAFALSFAAFATISTAYVAYPQAAYAQSYSFSSVSVDGNERVSTETILSFAGINRGETITAAELNDGYQKIVATGLFESVEIIPQGGRLLIKVSEYPFVSRVNFEGNRVLKDDALAAIIRTQPRGVFSPTVAEQDAAAIAEAYADKGQLVATVTPQIIRRSGNRVDVVYQITEGKGVEIERLSFVGNRNFSDSRLRRVLETKQAGIFRFIVGRDTYNPDRIDFDRQVLTDFYNSRGYIDFSVLNVSAEFSRERNAHFVTFSVQEGQSYDFGSVTVASEIDEADEAEFARLINIRAGQTYSPVAVENVISRMEDLATRKGIDFLRVEPRITRNDRDLSLDVEFALVRGPRVFIERIDIEGNQTTLDRVVRNQFRVVEGDPFNPRQIREAAERIRALGFFSNADVNAREGSSSDRVVVDVDVDEQPTGSFSFGANYSVSEGVNLLASFSERNFLGRGQTLSFDLTTQLEDGTLRFNFIEPAFLGRDVAFGFGMGISSSQASYAEHSQRLAYIEPSLTFPLSQRTRLRLDARAEWVELTEEGTVPAYIDPDMDTRVDSQTLGYTLSFDSRRNNIDANYHYAARFGQDITVGGDVDYVRTTASLSASRKLFNDNLTLLATIEGGMIDADGGSRVNNRFFNTTDMIRGFEPGGIGPRENNGSDDIALGGNKYAVARLEAQFPLGLPEEYGITGGLFLDHGAVWDLDNPGTIDDDLYWRTVAGASIFLSTPIGPLRFNFSKALNKETYDIEQSFDLTISTEF